MTNIKKSDIDVEGSKPSESQLLAMDDYLDFDNWATDWNDDDVKNSCKVERHVDYCTIHFLQFLNLIKLISPLHFLFIIRIFWMPSSTIRSRFGLLLVEFASL